MQRILITGANRGLGLEFVRQYLQHGAQVIAACRHPGKALKLTELAAAHPGRLHVLPLDLTDERSIAELAREAIALTGAIDLLINNAGMLVSGEKFGALEAKTFKDTFAANAVGPLLLTQALTECLANGTKTKVINVSSGLGSIARTIEFGTPSYNMSKAALNMATRLLAMALAERGVTVVAVSPGWVKTDMGGAGATLTAEQSVASLISIIAKLRPADNGRFLSYDGKELPW